MPKIQLFAVTKSEFTKFLSNLCRLILCLMLRRAKCCLIRVEGEVFRGRSEDGKGKAVDRGRNQVLREMSKQGKNAQEIYESGNFQTGPMKLLENSLT